MMRKTPLKKIGRKRKARGSSEKRTFLSIWRDSVHRCEICGNHIGEPRAYCFAHVLPKNTHPELRCNPDNIMLVCSTDCHGEVDRIKVGKTKPIEDYLKKGKKVTKHFLLYTESYTWQK